MHRGVLCSSTEERCGFLSFHFQVHKLNLKLKSVYAAFPGLQSKLVWQEHQPGRISTERDCVIAITYKATSLMLLSGILTEASEQGFLSQLGPVIPSLFFLCPLPKIPRKAVKSDIQWNQSFVLLAGYPPLNLRGTWGHSLWLNKWLLCPGGINLTQACQHKPCIFMGSFQRNYTGSEFLFSSETQHPLACPRHSHCLAAQPWRAVMHLYWFVASETGVRDLEWEHEGWKWHQGKGKEHSHYI